MSNCKRNSATTCGWFTALLLSALLAGCGGGGGGIANPVLGAGPTSVLPGAAGTPGAAATDPTVGSASPGSGATNVATATNGAGNILAGKLVTATFTQAMNPATINSAPAGTLLTFTLKEKISGINVPGTVAMNAANTVATFTPTGALTPNMDYTATITTAAKNAGGTAIASPVVWSFKTNAAALTAQAPVVLGKAGTFAIFSNTAVTSVFQSDIKGNVGTAGGGAGTTIACTEVTVGTVWDTDSGFVNAACRTTDPVFVGAAAGDMLIAYNDAKGRVIADFTDLFAGLISGKVLTPGLYKWNSGVLIDNTGITITGGADDVWIFQMTGDLTLQNGAIVTLGGAAQAKNIFWQVGGGTGAILGTTVAFKGIILADKAISVDGGVGTGAVVTGRLLANTLVSLKMNTITPPAP